LLTIVRVYKSSLLTYLLVASSAHNHSTTLVPGRAVDAAPQLDSTHMNGLADDKKQSVVPTAQSMRV